MTSPRRCPPTQPGNHGPNAGSICKETRPQHPQPGKHDYFTQPKTYSASGAWEFFTDDGLQALGGRQVAGALALAVSGQAPKPHNGVPKARGGVDLGGSNIAS